MSRHQHKPHRPAVQPGSPQPVIQETAAPLSPGGARRMAWGRATVAIWYLGGFVLLLAAALLQVGPSAWMAAWEVRRWGGDNPIVSFLPGFVVLAAPVLLLQLLPRLPEGSFLRGMQDGLRPTRSSRVQPPSPERMSRILLLCARGALVAAGVFLVAGGLGYELITRIGDRGAGAPLPELTFGAIAAPGATLPPYARLVGAAPRPELTWLHDHSERRTHHRDAFTPLTGDGWRSGDPVTVLEEDRTLLGEDGPGAVLPSGPVEGALGRGALPGWMVAELRRSGVAVVDDPVVLVRRDLNGVVPGADMVGAILCLAMGAVFSLFSVGISLGWLHRRRKLLRATAAGV